MKYDDAGFYKASACYNHILSNNFGVRLIVVVFI